MNKHSSSSIDASISMMIPMLTLRLLNRENKIHREPQQSEEYKSLSVNNINSVIPPFA